jgi:hypothetical protein
VVAQPPKTLPRSSAEPRAPSQWLREVITSCTSPPSGAVCRRFK